MTNKNTPDDKLNDEDARFVEFAERTLEEAMRRGVPPPSRRFVEKCTIESGAIPAKKPRGPLP
jgi:hypothetical protein